MKKTALILLVALLLSVLSITVGAVYSDLSKYNTNYTLTGNKGEDLANIAYAQLGKTRYDLGFPGAWCAMFVSDCARLAGIPTTVLAENARAAALNFGLTEEYRVANEDAKNGDLVFWYCNVCNTSTHVGIYYNGTTVSGNNGGGGGSVKTYKDTAFSDSRGHRNTFDIRYYRLYPSDSSMSEVNTMVPGIVPVTEPVEDGGIYYIVSALDEERGAVTIADGSAELMANVNYGSRNIGNSQKFRITKTDDYYTIINIDSQMAVDVSDGSYESGANVWQYTPNGTKAQRWKLEDAGDGYYYIKSALGNYLEVADGATEDGTNIRVLSFNGRDSQRWKLVPAYYFDLNAAVDGVGVAKLDDYCSVDVYVDGECVGDDVTDYSSFLASGIEFEINDIKVDSDYTYTGEPVLKGSIENDAKYMVLSFVSGHTHSYTVKAEEEHPHKQYMICSCGEKEYTGDVEVDAKCEACHEHEYLEEYGSYETEHPHKYVIACSCGDKKYTGKIADESIAELFFNDCEICKSGKFTLIYDGNGGVEPPLAVTVNKNDSCVVISEQVMSRNGYYFLGWSTDKNASVPEYVGADEITLKKDVVLYAVWSAENAQRKNMVLNIDSNVAYIDGEEVFTDAAPVIKNSRTMLPARFVAENLGATVSWDEALQQVTVQSDKVTIQIVIGNDTAVVNGEQFKLDAPAFIENGRTFAPVRFICESLGAAVDWNDEEKLVTVKK